MRVLVALGGNAMAGPDGSSGPAEQIAAAETAMQAVAELIGEGWDVVVTHGNGPQVGDLLVKNEVAAAVVPPVPLDWCVAQTQATIGMTLLDALDAALAERGVRRQVAALVTRVLVDSGDIGFTLPTKPIGRFLTAAEAEPLVAHGESFANLGPRGWRRVVASPEPLEILDATAIDTLVAAGLVVVANGGGGIPVVREADGRLRGIEAVIDKDLGAALLARQVNADRLVIATDVEHAMVGYGTANELPLAGVDVTTLRRHAAAGEFASGSMGPKVEAVCRFAEQTGRPGVITSLGSIVAAVRGERGTVVRPD